MRDDLYIKVYKRVERRLSGPPRWGTIHALVFSAFAVPIGLFTGVFFARVGVIDFLAYATIVGWSLLLFLHAGYLFLHSGALKRRRERVIQEEVLDAGDSFDLSEGEMIALHTRLDETIRHQSQAHVRLLANAFINVLLWPAAIVLVPVAVLFLGLMSSATVEVVARFVLMFAVLGTFLAAFALPFRALRPSTRDETDNLRAVYGYKRKREASRHAEAAERLSIGDDGELIAAPPDDSEQLDYQQAD